MLLSCVVLSALSLLSSSRGASQWQDVVVSNVAPRYTATGGLVGAQDGNLVSIPDAQGGGFALLGINYGNCAFQACKNTTEGSCGFGPSVVSLWRSSTLAQSDWGEPVELLPLPQRPSATTFRPHLIWCPATRKWVLWLRWLYGNGPISSQNTTYLTATADAVEGPYAVANANLTMFWPNSADYNLFYDSGDGAAYIAHTARSTGTKIVVEKLTPDFTGSAGATDPSSRSDPIGPGGTEAPALFKVGSTYYLSFASLCCYCPAGAATQVYTAQHPLGPYSALTSLGNAPGAQQNFVFSAPGKLEGVLWGGNRWGSDPIHPAGPLFDYSLQYWGILNLSASGNITALTWQDKVVLRVYT
jgi:hypothetical protein